MNKIATVLVLLSVWSCSEREYELAFASDRFNETDICIFNTKDDKIINLTNSEITEYNFTWTDDGESIFYTAFGPNSRRINSINVNTKKISNVLQDATVQSVSDVASDKHSLIISTKEHHPKGELYIYTIQDHKMVRLTENDFFEAGAKFSPKEDYVVASIQTKASDSVDVSGVAEIFRIDLSDLSHTQLTNMNGFSGLPEVSPNGKKIAFHHCLNAVCDVYIMNSDGSELLNLTQGKDDNRWPRWSPDGKWIAFTKTTNENSDIYFVSPDGKTTKPVIISEFRDEIAIFKPF